MHVTPEVREQLFSEVGRLHTVPMPEHAMVAYF